MTLFIFVGFFGLFGFLLYYGYKTNKKRIADLKAFAQGHSLSFSAERDSTLTAPLSAFSIFNLGHSRYAYNSMQGRYKNYPILEFDYHYAITERSHDNNRTEHYYLSIIAITLDFILKPLLIRPENFFDKIGEFIGLDDIDFESSEFSRKFFVKAQDKKFAYDIIHQKTMEYLLQNPSVTIESHNTKIIFYKRRLLRAGELEKSLDFGIGFIGLLPDYLVKELKEATAQ